MDNSAIIDRRHLRRKLGFWRILALLLVVLLAFGLYWSYGPRADFAKGPQIARVEVSGFISDDKNLLDRLKAIEKDDNVKALIVSISSPGGTTYGGERIFKAIRAVAAKKPVVSDIRTLAASAAYLTAIAGDHIVAGDTSITGSIGVLFQYPQVKDLMDKLGVSLEEIKSAPLKAEPSPFHPPTDDAKAMIRNMVLDSYDWFVGLVADRRHMSHEAALKLADGSIYTGRQALKLGLVDSLGGDADIRAYLKSRNVDENLRIVDWKKPSRSSPFFARAAVRLAKLIGFDGLAEAANVPNFVADKLFLDGLLSVWQGADR